jgi:hypothetical protein
MNPVLGQFLHDTDEALHPVLHVLCRQSALLDLVGESAEQMVQVVLAERAFRVIAVAKVLQQARPHHKAAMKMQVGNSAWTSRLQIFLSGLE